MAQKFMSEFYLAVQQATGNEQSSPPKCVSFEQLGVAEQLTQIEYVRVLQLLGFYKQHDEKAKFTDDAFYLLKNEHSDDQISSEGLFNFLCYLQSIETIIRPLDMDSDLVTLNKYGLMINDIFYIPDDSRATISKKQLIKQYYELLAQRKSSLRHFNV